MNWARAKTISIIMFIFLNGVLLFMNYLNSRQYVLAPHNINAVTAVLNRNNITLAPDFNFIRSNPQRQINLDNNNLRSNSLANVFFINNTNISIEHNDYTIFNTGQEKIIFGQNTAFYRNLANMDYYFENETYARLFSTGILLSLGEIGRDFSLQKITQEGNTLVLDYRQVYRNFVIYNNFMIFTFTNNNIYSIDFSYRPVLGFTGFSREIRPVDEALLAFMRRADTEASIIIESINLVYYAEDLLAMPYYRIVYHQESRGVVLINAYTLQ